jgi:DNA-directed RNA polymerase II subunit RPB1
MRSLHLRGIPEISKVYVQEANIKFFDPETGAYNDKQTEWEILTDGTNLKEIFKIDKVDFRRVTSNDINQIYECLGIEAVRNTLIKELRKVLGHYGIYVNYRHLAVLCDVMTQCGYLTSITRHGINRVEQGPLRKCSFEETVEILLDAGLFSQIDTLKGISENIMLGQLAPYGTGCFDIIFDTDKIKNAEFIEDPRLLDPIENIEDDRETSTPNINYNDGGFSPSRTPFGMKTPGIGFGANFTPRTSYRNSNSPMFTPGGLGSRTPIINSINDDNQPVVNITSPYPFMRGAVSPGYNPSERGYSPIYDSDSSLNNSKFNQQYYGGYSPREIMSAKSPCINQAYNRFSNQVQSPLAYSPSSPMIHTGKASSHGMSPSYNPISSNVVYSPTTPLNHRGTSPEYSKGNYYSVRSNSYSLANSPKLNYSPNSPTTFNPKSPAYNITSSSKTKKFYYLLFLFR